MTTRNNDISLEAWRAAGSVANISGYPMFFREQGEGPALLLIHGFPTASWDWSWIWDDLASDHRVIAPDLLGYGFSAKPLGHDYCIADQADRCEALLASVGIKKFHVLAHDYGDTVAQELLARSSEGSGAAGLQTICFLNGGLIPEAHRPRLIQKLLYGPLGPLLARAMSRKRFGKSFSAVFGPDTQPTDSEIDAFWALIVHNDGWRVIPKLLGYMPERKVRRQRWVGALTEAVVPVGVVNGSLDPVSGRHLVARYRELVGERDFILELGDVGHYPQVEAPRAVIDAWRRFIQSVGASEA